MNIVYQRHPTNPACVIIHVPTLFASVLNNGVTEIEDMAFRQALEVSNNLVD